MAAAVRVRGDYEAAQIRVLAKRSKNAAQTRRLLALAAIYDGGSRSEAARIGGVGLQTVRDWGLAFNAEGPPGLVKGRHRATRHCSTNSSGRRCTGSSRAVHSTRAQAVRRHLIKS